jgi:hypothetical protein
MKEEIAGLNCVKFFFFACTVVVVVENINFDPEF